MPFDFDRRRVSVLVDDGTTRLLAVKGAPEDIIQLSVDYATSDGERRELDAEARHELLQRFERLGEGYRVLGVAYRAMPPAHDSAVVSDETELTFAGFAVFVDPPKCDAAAAVQALAAVGVEVKILTGDNERRRRCRLSASRRAGQAAALPPGVGPRRRLALVNIEAWSGPKRHEPACGCAQFRRRHVFRRALGLEP